MQTRTKLALLQLLGGIVGWAWIFLAIASVLLFASALVFHGRWSSFFWALGGSALAKFLTRGFMEAQESVHAESTRNSARGDLQRAEVLVNAYGATLERCGSMRCSEELLPAPKDEIKAALISAARASRTAGQDAAVEHLRVGYASLANFVPAAEAHSSNRLDQLVPEHNTASPEALVKLAHQIASLPESPAPAKNTDDFAQLIREFDASIAREENPA